MLSQINQIMVTLMGWNLCTVIVFYCHLVNFSVYLIRVSCMNLSNNYFYRFSTYRLPHFQHLLHKRFRLVASCVEVFSCLSKHTRMLLYHTLNYSESNCIKNCELCYFATSISSNLFINSILLFKIQ